MNEGFSGSSCIRVCTRYLRAICLSLFYLPVSTTLAESTGLFPDILLILREGEANPLYFRSRPLNSRSLPSTTSFAILLIIGLTELFFYSQKLPNFSEFKCRMQPPGFHPSSTSNSDSHLPLMYRWLSQLNQHYHRTKYRSRLNFLLFDAPNIYQPRLNILSRSTYTNNNYSCMLFPITRKQETQNCTHTRN